MTALEQLEAYLSRLELRFRLFAAARGSAVTAASALLLTVLFVWIGNQFEFADRVTLPLRILLYLATAAIVSAALAVPLLKLNRRWVTRRAEQHAPGFEQRLLTLSERPDPANPFTELLAEDALQISRQYSPDTITPTVPLYAFGASAVIALGVLMWIVLAGPGYWGYGASLLWTGHSEAGSRPLYDISVLPGTKTIRRKADQVITARLRNFSSRQVVLHVRPAGAKQWDQIPMQSDRNGDGYQFLFAGVSDSVDYYVQAGATQSKHFTLNVKDLPSVKRVRVLVHFPSGLGLKDIVDDPGGDVRAVEQSDAEVSVLVTRPLENGILQFDDGHTLKLAHTDGNWYSAHFRVEKDGAYHVAEIDHGEAIRISEDYFIEARKDEPPTVKIVRPGHDPHVSPIEEVPITVEAADDFGLKSVDLHYSVNGGPDQLATLMKSGSGKDVTGKTTLYFENFKLVPGDLVSMYATARDAQKTSRSDILFAQAEPFNYTFRQSQEAGGGGGGQSGGNESSNISERQKQIIAATWNEVKGGSKERATAAENARFLSDLEAKLGDQAKALAERMGNRDLATASPEFESFSRTMTQASDEMKTAVSQLKPGKWNDALPPEQRALQALLRAEATFREIQVAFGRSGSGGGGGGGSAGRDLERLFDLELDTDKNQYETGASNASPGEQQKAMDEALQRLEMLARRQQELAQQKRQEQTFQQRWEEEQLRREAEDLRKKLEQLAKNDSGQQQSDSGQQGESQSSASSSSSSSSPRGKAQASRSGRSQQQQQTADAMRQTMESLERAEDEMRKSVSQGDSSARERAASELAKAQNALQNTQHQQAGQSLSDLAERSQQIAQSQREVADQIRSMYTGRSDGGRASEMPLPEEQAGQMPAMNDPRYPYGFRRRYMQAQPAGRPASDEEKQLANRKEGLGQQLEQLEKQLQEQAQRMQNTQPNASSKLRKALSNAESEELALRMQKNGEWMRQGFGSRTWNMEDSVTKGVEQLSREVQEAQHALNAGKEGEQSGHETAKALADVRRVRQQLEARLSRGQQPGSQQSSQKGSPRQGQSPGQNPAQQSGQGGSGEPTLTYSDVQSAMQILSGVRQQLGPRDLDKTLSRDLTDTLGSLRNLNNAKLGEMEARLSREVLPGLERLEIELNRRAGDPTGTPRLTNPEFAPESYRDAVAEYFKRLSR